LGLSPIGILLVSAIAACVGLNMASGMATFAGAVVALLVYGIGKTFFWPTMLAVASDRYPRTGAIAISIMGGIGMLSAGLIGSPGLGYAKDRFSGEELETANAALYEEYKSEAVSKFLFFGEANGIDPQKLDALKKKEDATDEEKETLNTLTAASIEGDRRTLKADSFIPGAMAVIYLLILLYFKSIGGYRPVTVEGNAVARNDADDSGGDDSGQKTD
jgi:hypothetical protein